MFCDLVFQGFLSSNSIVHKGSSTPNPSPRHYISPHRRVHLADAWWRGEVAIEVEF